MVRVSSRDGAVVVVVGFGSGFLVVAGGDGGGAVAGGGCAGGAAVAGGVGGGGAVVVVVPAVAPGRGGKLAGGVGTGLDTGPGRGEADPMSLEADGAVIAGAAGASGASEAFPAERAWSTSGRESGAIRKPVMPDVTSWTPDRPRRTPVEVPSAQLSARARRTRHIVWV
jgi:hypothetical protein